jgi:uroporphyrin-3 C-methyltransferase
MAESITQIRNNRVFLTVLGVISLLALAYAIMRVDILRARIADLEVHRDTQQDINARLNARNEDLIAANLSTQEQLKRLASVESELAGINATMGELRGRTEQSQRNWARVEALYLSRLADDQLALTHDPATALLALQAAEQRLTSVRDGALDGVRNQVAADINALRRVPQVDYKSLFAQLEQIENSVASLKVMGNVVNAADEDRGIDNSKAGIERAWLLVKQSVAKLFVIRKASTDVEVLITVEEQKMRRHHLQLLLMGLRQSAQLRDANMFKQTLSDSIEWLHSAFDMKDKQVAALEQQLVQLNRQDIAPALPDISGTRKMLERYVPAGAS